MRQCLRRLAVCSGNLGQECQQIRTIDVRADLVQEGHPLLHQDQPIGQAAGHRKGPASEGLRKVILVLIPVFLGKCGRLSRPSAGYSRVLGEVGKRGPPGPSR